MFGTDFLLEALLGILRGFLFKSSKAAQFAKYLIRARDYLLLLFPVEMYPTNDTDDAVLKSIGPENVQPVPIDAVKTAAKKNGFNIPFIKGM